MIPVEAVEAAAKASYEARGGIDWDLQSDELRDAETVFTRAALEAAAPYIAGAWHDAVSEAYVEGALSLEQASAMWNKNPYRRDDAR